MGDEEIKQRGVGDIVLLTRGQATNFYEVVKCGSDHVWVSNGKVQIRRKNDEVELICKAKNREDTKVPYIPFIN